MNGLQLFNYKGNEVRTIIRDGEPWWALKDICAALGIKRESDVWQRIRENDKMIMKDESNGSKPFSSLSIINEPALYEVIIRSDKPTAIAFRDWITHDVLPSIRRVGFYIDGQISTNNLKLLQQAVTELIETREKLESIEKEVALLQVRLDESSRLWSIKRRCALLKIDYHWYLDKAGRNQGWRLLKSLSHAMGKSIMKVDDANYPEGVNAYDIDVMLEAERLFAEGKAAC
jgi:prophage antirepressor-like protein